MPRRKKRQFSKRKQVSSKPPICYKCGKIGHKSPECTMKKKINELVRDEGLKKQLLAVLIDDSQLESKESYSDESTSSFSSSSSEVSASDLDDCQYEDNGNCLCALNGLSINVLSKEDNLILDIIDAIDDVDKKR